MSKQGKQVYISADYDEANGDRNVIEQLYTWNDSERYKVVFTDTAQVKSGSVSDDPDCRICELKKEFNKQINASSVVIFIVGDKTASRAAGRACERNSKQYADCYCTPYKANAAGSQQCKVMFTVSVGENEDVGSINTYSYLEHEFRQAAKRKNKDQIVILYNSTRKESTWLPDYMSDFADQAVQFWYKDENGNYKGDYEYIKKILGYE